MSRCISTQLGVSVKLNFPIEQELHETLNIANNDFLNCIRFFRPCFTCSSFNFQMTSVSIYQNISVKKPHEVLQILLTPFGNEEVFIIHNL